MDFGTVSPSRVWELYTNTQPNPPSKYPASSQSKAPTTTLTSRLPLADVTTRSITYTQGSSLPHSTVKRSLGRPVSTDASIPRTTRHSREASLKKENQYTVPGTIKGKFRPSLTSKVPTLTRGKPLAQLKPVVNDTPRPASPLPSFSNTFAPTISPTASPLPDIYPTYNSGTTGSRAGSRPTTYVTPPSSLSKTSPIIDNVSKKDSPEFQIAIMGIGEGDERSFSDVFADAWDESSIVVGRSVLGGSSYANPSSPPALPRFRASVPSAASQITYLSKLPKRAPIPVPSSAVASVFDACDIPSDSLWTLAAATDGSGGCDSRHDLASRTDSDDEHEDPFAFDSNPQLALVQTQSRSRSQLFSNLPHTTPPSNASFTITAPIDLSSSPPSPPPSPPSRAARFRSGTVAVPNPEEKSFPSNTRSRFSITPVEPPRHGPSGLEQDTFRRFSLKRTEKAGGGTVFVQDIGDEHIDDSAGDGSKRQSIGRWRVEVDADGLPGDMLQMLNELEGFARDLKDMNEDDLDTKVSPKTSVRIRGTLQGVEGSERAAGIKQEIAEGYLPEKEQVAAIPKIVVTQSLQSMTNAVEADIPEHSSTTESINSLGSVADSYASVLEGVLELCGAYDSERSEMLRMACEDESDSSESEDEMPTIRSQDKGKWRVPVEDMQECELTPIEPSLISSPAEEDAPLPPSNRNSTYIYLPNFAPEFLTGSSTSLVAEEAQGYHSKPCPPHHETDRQGTKTPSSIPTPSRRRPRFSLARSKVPALPPGLSVVPLPVSPASPVARDDQLCRAMSPPPTKSSLPVRTGFSLLQERKSLTSIAPRSAPPTISSFDPANISLPASCERHDFMKMKGNTVSKRSTIGSNDPFQGPNGYQDTTQQTTLPSRIPAASYSRSSPSPQTPAICTSPTRLPQPASAGKGMTNRLFGGHKSQAPRSAPPTTTTFDYTPGNSGSLVSSTYKTPSRSHTSSGVRSFFSRRSEPRTSSMPGPAPLPATKGAKARAMSVGAGVKRPLDLRAPVASSGANDDGVVGRPRSGSRIGNTASKLPSAKELLKRFG